MTNDAKLLVALREAGGSFVTLSEWGKRAGVPPSVIHARVAVLRKLGYDIEERPHLGYRLLSSTDALLADDLKSRLGARVVGSEIMVFQDTTSTNDIAERAALNGAREGLVIFAEAQSGGRGRRGRRWISPAGKGLWFSVVLRPLFAPAAVARLTILSSVAVAAAIREVTGLDARIKWPNDVLVGGRKVAGILTEMLCDADSIKHAIVGVGVNVRCQPQDFPPEVRAIASSLEQEAQATVSRPELALRILELLDEFYAKAHGQFEEIVGEWAALSSTLGKRVVVSMGTRRVEGQALALDGDGALLVRCDTGAVERIVGGDLELEKMQA